MPEKCKVCLDDGYVEVWDDVLADVVAVHDCPHLHDAGHAPFNATGILTPTSSEGDS